MTPRGLVEFYSGVGFQGEASSTESQTARGRVTQQPWLSVRNVQRGEGGACERGLTSIERADHPRRSSDYRMS